MDVVIAMIATGLGAWFWQKARVLRPVTYDRHELDDDAEVALHVALHSAKSRGATLTSLDLLYGLVQNEAIASAVARAGGDAAVLEDRVLSALGASGREDLGTLQRDAEVALSHASVIAAHAGRRATCIDLWAHLHGTEADTLLAAERPTRLDVLVAAVHGSVPALPEANRAGDVLIVLRNDDYTPQELVTTLLVDVFGLARERAEALMLETHERGKATVARLRAAEARTKLERARAFAREAGAPLYLGFEPT